MKTNKLELLNREHLTAGEIGKFRLRITVGEPGVASGGGFVVYPPITTMPHVWAMVRWKLGGVYIFCSSNAINADTPVKNVLSMYEVVLGNKWNL